MNESTETLDDVSDKVNEYGTKRAAEFLNLSVYERGYKDVEFDSQIVLGLAKTHAIKSKKPKENEKYKFQREELQEYIDKNYPTDVRAQPEVSDPQVDTFSGGRQTKRTRSLKEIIEANTLWYLSILIIGAFSAGIAASLFVVPELRTKIGVFYINSNQPLSIEDISKINRMLEDTPVESDLNSLLEKMVSEKIGVFGNITQNIDNEIVQKVLSVSPDDKVGLILRGFAKNGKGPFKSVDKSVKLQFVKAGDADKNSQLKKIRNFNVGACEGDFAFGSTIHIYAPGVKSKLIAPNNFAMIPFFAGAEITFDCERDDEEPPTIWVNLSDFAKSFSIDSANMDQISEYVEATVTIGLQPVVLIPTTSL